MRSAFPLATLVAGSLAAPTFTGGIGDMPGPPIPVVLWHGLGDNYAADGIKQVGDILSEIWPSAYFYAVRLDEDPGNDRKATFFGNLTEQVQKVCDDFAQEPVLSNVEAIDALGFSQGGLFLRAYVERCNKPPVRNLITMGSPHNGIADFAGCGATDWLCKGAMALLKGNTWGHFVQSTLVPAQYYRSTDADTGEPTDDYLEYSNFLADINNERALRNMTYASNLAQLENFVMYEFTEDKTVVPKESTSFAQVNLTSSEVTPLRNRTLYKENWLGLQSLDKKGGLHLEKAPGQHMNVTRSLLEHVFKKYAGPLDRTGYPPSSQKVLGDLEL